MKTNLFKFRAAVWVSVAAGVALVAWLPVAGQAHPRETVHALALCVVVLMAVALLLARALYKLRKPMNIAVSIADRIAEGKPVRDHEFDVKHGMGNLLPALGRMYMSMTMYRFDAAEKIGRAHV